MTEERRLRVRDLVADAQLGVELTVAAGAAGLDRTIGAARIQKSGLALAGHFHGIDRERVQVLGVTETSYLAAMPSEVRDAAFDAFLSRDPCCVVVTQSDDLEATSPLVATLQGSAERAGVPLLFCVARSSRTITALHARLDERLAPRARLHGVLVDVHEVGMLIVGESGAGKSEVALELVMRGHRLVADDVVDCHHRPPNMVFGAPADLLRHHLEVRGLGILNIKDLFGVTAIRDRKRIDLVVQLVEDDIDHGDDGADPASHHTASNHPASRLGATREDRLGVDRRAYTVLGTALPALTIVVRPGRDMASILEIAARRELLRASGHRPERAFLRRIERARAGLAGTTTTPPEEERPLDEVPGRKWTTSPPESSVGMSMPQDEGGGPSS